MTRIQFDRWREFSLGLAATYPRATDRRCEKLVGEIQGWFDLIDSEGWWQGMTSWDTGEKGTPCVCDLFADHFDCYDHWSETREDSSKFFGQLSCCIRAGMDVASAPSAGVVGFTVGDVRTAFGGDLPEWFTALYEGIEGAADTHGVWL